MKIYIGRIPDAGLDIPLKPSEAWIAKIVKETVGHLSPDMSSISGSLHLSRSVDVLSLDGQLSVALNPNCDKCLESFKWPFEVVIRFDLSPLFHSPKERDALTPEEEIEVELSKDDLDFRFYEGNELDVADLVRESVILDLPQTFICRFDCQGLCATCGSNRNLKPCSCNQGLPTDIRWEALKNFPPKKKPGSAAN